MLARRTGARAARARRSARSLRIVVAVGCSRPARRCVVYLGLDRVLGHASAGAQIVAVGAALAVSVGVYLAACRALGVRELQALLSLRRRAPGA